MKPDPSFFGHLMVLISIVLGLGITQLASSTGAILRNRKKITLCLPLVGWVSLVCLVLVQFWWAMWDFSEVRLTIWDYGAIILLTILHYMMATVVLPNFSSPDVVAELFSRGYSLESFYLRNVAWMSAVAVTLLVAIMAADLFIFGLGEGTVFVDKLPYRLGFMALLVTLWITGGRDLRRAESEAPPVTEASAGTAPVPTHGKPGVEYRLSPNVWALHSVCTLAFAVVLFWFIVEHSSDVPGKLQRGKDGSTVHAAQDAGARVAASYQIR